MRDVLQDVSRSTAYVWVSGIEYYQLEGYVVVEMIQEIPRFCWQLGGMKTFHLCVH